jgi:hypothetical protein
LPAPDVPPMGMDSPLTPLPVVSLHVASEVSTVDALPAVPETLCSVDGLITALASHTSDDMFMPTPSAGLPAIAELPAIRASETDGRGEAGNQLVPPPPLVLPPVAELPDISVSNEPSEDVLCFPEPTGPDDFEEPEPVRSEVAPTMNPGGKPRPAVAAVTVTPNGRKRRKMMRRMRAHDWTG